MSGTDGLQLLGEIKQRFPALSVMTVTAYATPSRQRAGAAKFLLSISTY